MLGVVIGCTAPANPPCCAPLAGLRAEDGRIQLAGRALVDWPLVGARAPAGYWRKAGATPLPGTVPGRAADCPPPASVGIGTAPTISLARQPRLAALDIGHLRYSDIRTCPAASARRQAALLTQDAPLLLAGSTWPLRWRSATRRNCWRCWPRAANASRPRQMLATAS